MYTSVRDESLINQLTSSSMLIFICKKVVDSTGVECAGTTNDTVYLGTGKTV